MLRPESASRRFVRSRSRGAPLVTVFVDFCNSHRISTLGSLADSAPFPWPVKRRPSLPIVRVPMAGWGGQRRLGRGFGRGCLQRLNRACRPKFVRPICLSDHTRPVNSFARPHPPSHFFCLPHFCPSNASHLPIEHFRRVYADHRLSSIHHQGLRRHGRDRAVHRREHLRLFHA